MQWLVYLIIYVFNYKKFIELQVFLLMLQFSSAMERLGNSPEEGSDIVSYSYLKNKFLETCGM